MRGYAASLLLPHSGAPLCTWPNVSSPALALAKGFVPMGRRASKGFAPIERRASEPSRLRLSEERTPVTTHGRAVGRPSTCCPLGERQRHETSTGDADHGTIVMRPALKLERPERV